MFGFGEAQQSYDQVYNQDQPDNKAEFSHELLAGGASFMAFKTFEDHQRKEGKPVDHQFAKEMLAGFAGAEVDRLAETKGADYIDREKAKHEAKRRANDLYDQHYGGQDQYDPNGQPPREIQDSFGGGYGGGQGGYGGDQFGGQQGGYGGDQFGGQQGGYGGGDQYQGGDQGGRW